MYLATDRVVETFLCPPRAREVVSSPSAECRSAGHLPELVEAILVPISLGGSGRPAPPRL